MAKDKKRHEDLNQVVKDLVLNAGAILLGSGSANYLKPLRNKRENTLI